MEQNTKDRLIQLQALPLEAKVHLSQNRIREWYEHWDGDVYVSFSGGKDSTVLRHIVLGMYPDVPCVFVNTGLEYPEVRRFALAQPGTVRVDPEMTFPEVIDRFGYPVISKEQSQNIYEYRNTKSEYMRKLRREGNH